MLIDDRAMPVITFQSDPRETKRRLSELQSYFSKNLFKERGKCCDCSFYEKSCRPSHRGDFYYGKLHHVGEHYDLSRRRWPLRIAVVAQDDNTHKEFKTFRKRSKEVLASSRERFSRNTSDSDESCCRNPHMRGTTSLLRLIFQIG
jgi:hypothetical protein